MIKKSPLPKTLPLANKSGCFSFFQHLIISLLARLICLCASPFTMQTIYRSRVQYWVTNYAHFIFNPRTPFAKMHNPQKCTLLHYDMSMLYDDLVFTKDSSILQSPATSCGGRAKPCLKARMTELRLPKMGPTFK